MSMKYWFDDLFGHFANLASQVLPYCGYTSQYDGLLQLIENDRRTYATEKNKQ